MKCKKLKNPFVTHEYHRVSNDFEELAVHLAGEGSGKKGLTGTRRSVEEDSFGRLDTDSNEELRVCKRQLNCLS